MTINRRAALKHLGLITGGLLLLPACSKQASTAPGTTKNFATTADQEALLAEISDTIIPTTDTPGAKALKVPEYVLHMVDDCYDKESQQRFADGLSKFDAAAQAAFNKPFAEGTTEERVAFLKSLETDKEMDQTSPVEACYAITKRLTIDGYLHSQYVMTNVLPHNMIPGKFQGCIEIKDAKDIKSVIA